MRGSVVKKGARWYVIIEQRHPQTGERRRKWHSGFRTRKDAERARVELLHSTISGSYVEPSKDTVARFLKKEWLPAAASTIRPATLQSYESIVDRHLVPQIGAFELQSLMPAHLNRMYGNLVATETDGGAGLSVKTVRNVHAVIRKALADALRWGRVNRNVADLADPPRSRQAGRPEMRSWSAGQLAAFLRAIERDRLHAAWLLAATTGMRRGEVLGLRWQDVDLEARRLAIRQTLVSVAYKLRFSTPKTARGRRSIALDRTTVTVLREHRQRQLEERMLAGPVWQELDLVFCREDGRPVHPDGFSKTFGRLARDADLPRIRLHDLRHTHATLALQAGLHPKVVSERLGHATVSFTLDVYSHTIPAMQEELADRVAALVFSYGR